MIDPFVKLAEGVVWRALEDVTCRAVHAMPEALRVVIAADALDFLLRRVWDDECLWGVSIRPLVVERHLRERALRRIRPDVVRTAAQRHPDLRPTLLRFGFDPRTGRRQQVPA